MGVGEMGSDELSEIVGQVSSLALVGALVWLMLLGARSIGSLATAVLDRWARWELLDHAERTIDLSPIRQHLGDRWPRQQTAPRARVLAPYSIIVGIE